MRYVSMTLEVPSGTTYENRVNVETRIPKGRILSAMIESESSDVKLILSCGSRRFLPGDYEDTGVSYITLNNRCRYFPVDCASGDREVLALEGWTD